MNKVSTVAKPQAYAKPTLVRGPRLDAATANSKVSLRM
jgi:hypothetical protein